MLPTSHSRIVTALIRRSRFTADENILRSTMDGVNWTFTFHGDVAGSIIGDERESNLSPNRG